MLLVSGKPDSVFTTQCDTFQQPRHVPRKGTHGLQPFRIPANLLRRIPVYYIPILRRHDGHIAVRHVFVHLVECCCRTAAATGGYRCGRFAGKVVAVELVDEKYPIQKRSHRTARRRVMDGRAEHEPVVIVHHFHELIDLVIAETAPFAHTRPTSDTPGYGLVADPECGGIYAFTLQRIGNFG